MRYSKLFGKTVKTASDKVKVKSHELLLKAGFIRESTAGRYFYLPLGLKVRNKIIDIVREEMDKTGAQEMISPVLHPIDLWKQTNRTESVGFELTTLKDRRGTEFVLGGTAEEMFVDVVKKFNISYRDLPFNIYQFSSKFRDELRSRGGLLRLREFVMKDAYSFDRNEEEFKKTYGQMAEAYHKVFERLGLKAMVVESDNGYIGGEYCHEFIVEDEAGESHFLVNDDCSYAAHEDVAKFKLENKNINEEEKEYQEVEAVRNHSMEDGVKLHHLPLWQQIKDVMFVDDKGKMILAVIRGDLDVNEVKLAHVISANTLRKATDDEIRAIGSEPGFISPVGLDSKVEIIGDASLRTIKNAYGGANKKNVDALNINIDRDYKCALEVNIAMAKAGYPTEDGKLLSERKGIEVGNIFQLGYHYSKKMEATFADEDGEEKYYYMGCYGLGIGRTLATIIQKYHDDKGMIWPESVSPFKVHLISLGHDDEVLKMSESLYENLRQKNVDVLWDDRVSTSAGEKFADADLLGFPYRVVISPKTLKENKVEVKKRDSKDFSLVSPSEFIDIM